jgi:hypothetical protein
MRRCVVVVGAGGGLQPLAAGQRAFGRRSTREGERHGRTTQPRACPMAERSASGRVARGWARLLAERQSLVRRCIVVLGARGGLQRLAAGQKASGRRSTRGGERHGRTTQPCARPIAERSASGQARGRSVLLRASVAHASMHRCLGRPRRPPVFDRRPEGVRAALHAGGERHERTMQPCARPIAERSASGGKGVGAVARRASVARASMRCWHGRPRRPPAFDGRPEDVQAALHAGGRAARAHDAAVRASDRRAIRLGASEGALGVAHRSSVARALVRGWRGRPRRPPAFGRRPEGVRAALHAGGERHGRTTQPRACPTAERSASGGKGVGAVARRASFARASMRCWLGRPRVPPAFGGPPEGVRAALHAEGERHERTTQPRARPIAEQFASGGKGVGSVLLADRQSLVRRRVVVLGARGGLQRLAAGQRASGRRSTREGERHERTIQPCARPIAEQSASGASEGALGVAHRSSVARATIRRWLGRPRRPPAFGGPPEGMRQPPSVPR